MDYLIFKLYIVKYRAKDNSKEPIFRIAYGVVNPISQSLTSPTYSQWTQIDNNKVFSTSIGITTICKEKPIIEGIIQGLLSGKYLKTILEEASLDIEKMNFDVRFTDDYYDRPYGQDEIFKNEVVYSKSYLTKNIDALTNVFNVDEYVQDETQCHIASWLQDKTSLPFKDKYSDHLGSIDLLSQPARNFSGRSLISSEFNKAEKVQKIHISKDIANKYNSFIVNWHVVKDGIVIIDEIDSVKSDDKGEILKEINDYYDSIRIKVWGVDDVGQKIIYDDKIYLLKTIEFNAQISEGKLHLSTSWLNEIRKNVAEKYKKDVEGAAEIARTGNETSYVGEKPKKPHMPLFRPKVKTNDVFFPQGWNSEKEEHGRIAFILWFKEKTKNVDKVFLQDPYFEDVALEFFALSASGGEFTVLTQSKLATNSDGTANLDKETKDNSRGTRIVNMIESHPTLFKGMKLIIKDIQSSSNELHDRYLFFYYKDGHTEAYTLSNSLQGATKKYPLLITQIGDNAFSSLLAHIKGLITSDAVVDLYRYDVKSDKILSKNKELADKELYVFIKNLNPKSHEFETTILKAFHKDFLKSFSTFGYYLATSDPTVGHDTIQRICNLASTEFDLSGKLSSFLKSSIFQPFPIGFLSTPNEGYWTRRQYSRYFDCLFNQIVTRYNIDTFGYVNDTGISYRVWGQFFAGKIIVKRYPQKTIELLDGLENWYKQLTGDKIISPVTKLSNMLIVLLLCYLSFVSPVEYIAFLLHGKGTLTKAFGALHLIWNVKKGACKLEDYKGYFDNDEAITVCHAAISDYSANEEIRNQYFNWLLSLYENKKEDDILKLIQQQVDSEEWVASNKNDYLRHILPRLISDKKLDANIILNNLSKKLFMPSINSDINVFGVLNTSIITLEKVKPSAFLKEAKKYLKGAQRKFQDMPIKESDKVFKYSKPIIELKAILLDIMHNIDGNLEWQAELVSLTQQCDELLKDSEFEDYPSTFDSWKANGVGGL